MHSMICRPDGTVRDPQCVTLARWIMSVEPESQVFAVCGGDTGKPRSWRVKTEHDAGIVRQRCHTEIRRKQSTIPRTVVAKQRPTMIVARGLAQDRRRDGRVFLV